jgi:hypothetical protein
MDGTEMQIRRTRLLAPASALAVVGLLAAAPLVLWHRVLGDILASFNWTLSYLAAELGPWLLLAAGVGLLVPVAISTGLHPEDRLYPRARRRYSIWGVVLYLLAMILLVELYDLWRFGY